MKTLSNLQEKTIMDLENKWLRHKRLRSKDGCHEHQDFLTMNQREDILDKLFKIIFND